jgi:hypothetical protein
MLPISLKEGVMANKKKGKSTKSISRRDLLLNATKGAFALGALQFGSPKAGAQITGQLDLSRKKNRDLVYKALTDPAFRKQLESNPAAALGKNAQQFTDRNRTEIRKVLDTVKQIEDMLARISDELLCADGGPCGIAAPSAPVKR